MGEEGLPDRRLGQRVGQAEQDEEHRRGDDGPAQVREHQ